MSGVSMARRNTVCANNDSATLNSVKPSRSTSLKVVSLPRGSIYKIQNVIEKPPFTSFKVQQPIKPVALETEPPIKPKKAQSFETMNDQPTGAAANIKKPIIVRKKPALKKENKSKNDKKTTEIDNGDYEYEDEIKEEILKTHRFLSESTATSDEQSYLQECYSEKPSKLILKKTTPYFGPAPLVRHPLNSLSTRSSSYASTADFSFTYEF
jgi:hypothetical protein